MYRPNKTIMTLGLMTGIAWGYMNSVEASPIDFSVKGISGDLQATCETYSNGEVEKFRGLLIADNIVATEADENLVGLLTFSRCMVKNYTEGVKAMEHAMRNRVEQEISKETEPSVDFNV